MIIRINKQKKWGGLVAEIIEIKRTRAFKSVEVDGKILAYEVYENENLIEFEKMSHMRIKVNDSVARNKTYTYNSKIVISGDVIEVYEYGRPILKGYREYKKNSRGRSVKAEGDNIDVNRETVLKRAKRDLRRIINSNVHSYNVFSKFITLTFKLHVTTFEVANYEFKKFRQRLEYELGFKLKYTCVPEFTKKGRIHFHVLMYNCPYIQNKKLNELWGNGYVRINKIDNVDNVGSYVSEYVGKDLKEGTSSSDKMKGKKSYFNSRGLKKPLEIKDNEQVKSVVNSLPADKVVFENVFNNDYNSVIYTQYNMKKVELTSKKNGYYL